MDGYAVSHSAKPQKGQYWKVVGDSSAGKPYTKIFLKVKPLLKHWFISS